MNRGIISKVLDWVKHPANSQGTAIDWAAGLAIIVILAFLWSTVVKQTIDA